MFIKLFYIEGRIHIHYPPRVCPAAYGKGIWDSTGFWESAITTNNIYSNPEFTPTC